MGDGVVDVDIGLDPLFLEESPVIDSVFRLGDNIGHGLQRLNGVLAASRFTGEHHAASAVVNRVGHVGDFSAGGTGVPHHRIQHLSGGNHRFACLMALADHLLLQHGNLCGRNLHTQITPGNHDTVSSGQDVVNVVHALLILDLGNNLDIVSAVLLEHLTDGFHISGAAHEGSGHEVKVILHAEADIGNIAFSQGRELDMRAGDIDGLVGRQDAAVFHSADNILVPDLLHPDGYQTVVNENHLSGFHLVGQIGVSHGNPGLIACDVICGQGKGVAGVQFNALALKALDTDFRSPGIQNRCHSHAHTVPHGFQAVQAFQMLGMAAVGEIEAGRVHSPLNQGADHLFIVHSGTQGADNFCFPHNHSSYGNSVWRILLMVTVFIIQGTRWLEKI